MSDPGKKRSTQEQAIHEYLQSLLFEGVSDIDALQDENNPPSKVKHEPMVNVLPAINETPSLPHDEASIKPLVIGLEQLVAEIPQTITETVSEVKIQEVQQEKVAVVTDVDTLIQVAVEASPAVKPNAEIPEAGIPDWAETRFQCLLFNVSGLSLAVPLVKLNSVIPWDENITETPNQTNWYLGLVQHLKKQVKVIDTALLVMPESRHSKLKVESENRLSHILLVDEFKWGLACSSIGDVIWLNKDEIKWRKNKTSRAWLSGTSLKHLCAIMDTQVFAKMLTESV